MIKLKTIDYDINYLSTKSTTVDITSEDIESLFKPLKEYAILNNLYGISGVSLGILKRIIYFYEPMINPVILKKTGLTASWENCINTSNYIGLMKRPYKIEVEYYNIKGEIIHKTFEGIDSTHFMHLYDHINGNLILDNSLVTFNMLTSDQISFKRSHPYRILSTTGDYVDLMQDHNLYLTKKLTKD